MLSPWRDAIGAAVDDDGQWTPYAGAAIRNGGFLVPGCLPVWQAFGRLSRGRNVTSAGMPCAISYRDLRDEAARVSGGLSADVIEQTLADLDNQFLTWCESDNKRRSADQHGRSGGRR